MNENFIKMWKHQYTKDFNGYYLKYSWNFILAIQYNIFIGIYFIHFSLILLRINGLTVILNMISQWNAKHIMTLPIKNNNISFKSQDISICIIACPLRLVITSHLTVNLHSCRLKWPIAGKNKIFGCMASSKHRLYCMKISPKDIDFIFIAFLTTNHDDKTSF